MNGSQLTAKVTQHIQKKYNGYVVNVIQASKNGVADLIVCVRGKFYALEIKGDNDKPSALQVAHIGLVKKSGGRANFIYSIADVDNLVKGI